jgi:phosphoribosylformimino-5-aminoimidazole carboxamide ribonucleotide (ProFAR) isomerase
VQGREKALEGDNPEVMAKKFAAFPEIQVIDLDAALERGTNDKIVQTLASKAKIRAGGGIRSVGRAQALISQGAHRLIIGTSAFTSEGPNHEFLQTLIDAIGSERVVLALDSHVGRIVIKGWTESTRLSAEDVIGKLEPYCSGFLCTYVDKEGMMQGTNLDWFRRLRACTDHEITAAGGITTIEDIQALEALQINAAIGMAIYTGRLNLGELAKLSNNR